MKSMLVAGVVGIVLFASSAAVSWYLMDKEQKPAETADAKKAPEEEEHGLVDAPPVLGEDAEKKEQLPVALRPDTPLSVEAVLELSDSIKRKEREIVEREKAVEKAEHNLKSMFDDLRVERAELLTLMDGIESKTQTAKSSLAELKQENQNVTSQKQELEKLKSQKSKGKKGQPETDEIAEKTKTVKDWIENLEPEKAAELVKEYANSGDLKEVIRILKSLPPKSGSDILDAINDAALVHQIVDAVAAEENAAETNQGAANSDKKTIDR
jgi:chromosome segregation ATPase